ncbi:MAG TPA: V4R domain-containing protein [Burkholderiaceae bacterium]|nr:V4R domain-containing protein [Burkholderiaceae bacterium]
MSDRNGTFEDGGPPPAGLRARLRWGDPPGALHDGPRRYLMMRADVLMGMLRALPPEDRARAADALARSVAEHGADSVRAYARQAGGDPRALLAATAAAAADLGWGDWRFDASPARLGLRVAGSPFAEGFGSSDAPVCAPIRGMLRAVAAAVAGADGEARELRCRACGDPVCEFEATWPAR